MSLGFDFCIPLRNQLNFSLGYSITRKYIHQTYYYYVVICTYVLHIIICGR